MATQFYLCAILKSNDTPTAPLLLHKIVMLESVSVEVRKIFENIFETWAAATPIPFAPKYTPPDSEVYKIPDFVVGAPFKNAVDNFNQLTPFNPANMATSGYTLTGFVGIKESHQPKSTTYYFQKTDSRNVLDYGKWYTLTYLMNGSYAKLTGGGVAIGDRLTAVVDPQKTLWFRTFQNTALFLDLRHIFEDATNEKIKQILGAKVIAADDDEIAKIAGVSDTPLRKQFSELAFYGTLDHPKVTATMLVKVGKEFGVAIETIGTGADRKVKFPPDLIRLRNLMHFLCHDFYKSPLTGENFYSNSHRRLTPPAS